MVHTPGSGERVPQGLMISTALMMSLGVLGSILGLVPCLGLLNWGAVPFNFIVVILAIIGLAGGPKKLDGSRAHLPLYVVALCVGLAFVVVSTVRCALGGFVL
jgi:putative exporter of polyketide antibiotics